MVTQILLFLWLGVVACQSLGILKFGVRKIPKSWVFYITTFPIAISLLDSSGFLNKSLATSTYLFLFIYFAMFNLAYIYNIYKVSPLINRLEHFLGCIVISLAVFAFMSNQTFYMSISSQNIKMILLFCIVTTLGVFNEIIELFFDILFKTKNIGPGLFDTNLDLLMNALGTGTFIVVAKYLGAI